MDRNIFQSGNERCSADFGCCGINNFTEKNQKFQKQYFHGTGGILMTLFEIKQSLILNSIYPIDRLHLEKYGGIFREVTIMHDNECRIDFLCKENKINNEGEISFYFKFGSFD